MNSTPPEIPVSEYEIWREFIQKRCGHNFPQSRRRFLRQRLWERMRIRKIKGYGDYYHYVVFNQAGEDEWKKLLELLLNNETGFFRHMPSFEALTKHVLPNLMQEKIKQGANHINMWSAGCSTGQEAYSMPMAFFDLLAKSAFQLLPVEETVVWQIKVTGSDISKQALEKARKGQYKSYETRYLSDRQINNYLTVVKNGQNKISLYEISDRVQKLVKFSYFNIQEPETYQVSYQDIIFCQNLLIYIDPEIRVEIVRQLCKRLNLGGYLFLAPAELIGLKLPGIRSIRLDNSLIYQRTE